jgi:hypothetical protein
LEPQKGKRKSLKEKEIRANGQNDEGGNFQNQHSGVAVALSIVHIESVTRNTDTLKQQINRPVFLVSFFFLEKYLAGGHPTKAAETATPENGAEKKGKNGKDKTNASHEHHTLPKRRREKKKKRGKGET